MALFTKCIKLNPSKKDGYRISIMSRHTLEDGITPDPEIKKFKQHWPVLAPTPRLIGDYYKRGLSWEKFEGRFNEFLELEAQQHALQEIIRMAYEGDVTLMCVEKTPEKCHRRLVAEKIKEMEPDLKVIIK